MNRREAIRKTSLTMGTAIAAPALTVLLKGCSPKRTLEWQPTLFTTEQAMTMEDICECIIPTTQTPGAKALGVARFVENYVSVVYKIKDRDRFMAGFNAFQASCQEQFQKTFIELSEKEQYDLLTPLNKQAAEEAIASHWRMEPEGYKSSFFRMVKELTVTGYYTSETGATQELQYLDIPGNYEGCIPLEKAGGKTWAT